MQSGCAVHPAPYLTNMEALPSLKREVAHLPLSSVEI
jgi:hypothetical protein